MKKETNMLSGDDFMKQLLEGEFENSNNENNQTDILDAILNPSEDPNIIVETDDEDKEPIVIEDEVIADIETNAVKRFGIKDSITKLIETETWVDMPLRYDGKEYESIEDLLSKEKINNELFEALSSAQKSYSEEKIKSQYISIKDEDETKVKLVNAILQGVDYKDLLEYNSDILKPIVEIDFANAPDNEELSESFVRQCLVEIDGIPAKYVNAEIAELKKSFRLVEKAEDYQAVLVDNFNQEVARRQQEHQDRLLNENNQTKNDIKELRSVLKSENLAEPFIQKIVKLRYTKDDAGSFHYESLIKDKIKDKKFEARLMHFLLDDEDLITKEKSKIKSETSTKFMEIINNSAKETKSGKASQGNLETEDEEFLRTIGLA